MLFETDSDSPANKTMRKTDNSCADAHLSAPESRPLSPPDQCPSWSQSCAPSSGTGARLEPRHVMIPFRSCFTISRSGKTSADAVCRGPSRRRRHCCLRVARGMQIPTCACQFADSSLPFVHHSDARPCAAFPCPLISSSHYLTSRVCRQINVACTGAGPFLVRRSMVVPPPLLRRVFSDSHCCLITFESFKFQQIIMKYLE